MHKHTHRFSSLWVDHLTLVEVKLALVILRERGGARVTIIAVANSDLFVYGAVYSVYLDKQFATSMPQQLMKSNLHLE